MGSAQADPCELHLQALKKVLRYLKGTLHMRLALGGDSDHSVQLSGSAYTHWGNDTAQRKSRSGYIFTLGTGTINYRSRQQTCVTQSTCEAEYYSAAEATREAIHIRHNSLAKFSVSISPTSPLRLGISHRCIIDSIIITW
jgi:hypothetical protein